MASPVLVVMPGAENKKGSWGSLVGGKLCLWLPQAGLLQACKECGGEWRMETDMLRVF